MRFKPGDRVVVDFLPHGLNRGTVLPPFGNDDDGKCPILLDPPERKWRVRAIVRERVRKLDTWDLLAEAAALPAPLKDYRVGQLIIMPTKKKLMRGRVSVITVHNEIILDDEDGDERLVCHIRFHTCHAKERAPCKSRL